MVYFLQIKNDSMTVIDRDIYEDAGEKETGEVLAVPTVEKEEDEDIIFISKH
jgi:hypothetical protein